MNAIRAMTATASPETIPAELLERKVLRLQECTVIQSLWAGYGQICRMEASSSLPQGSEDPNIPPQHFILKYVQPPTKPRSLKARYLDESHIRKVLYQFEQYFYEKLAPRMPQSICLASCSSSINSETAGTRVTTKLLSELRETHPQPESSSLN